MSHLKRNILGVIAILAVVIVAISIFLSNHQPAPLRLSIEATKTAGVNNDSPTNVPNRGPVLPAPLVTIYKEGFDRIEIPLQNRTGELPFINTAIAADNSVYSVYRSTSFDANIVQIATVQDNGNVDKYIAVYDTSYPTNATNLIYSYSLYSGGQTSYSGITSATLQQAVDEGLQPWRLDPLWVAEADHPLVNTISFREPCGGYGLSNSGIDPSHGTGKLVNESGVVTYCDVYSIVSQDVSAGVAEAKAIHNGSTYLFDLIQPVPGQGKIWMIKLITEGNG